MKLKIKITKDVLKRSMYCGTNIQSGHSFDNCAIAIAIKEIFPNACVTNKIRTQLPTFDIIELPEVAKDFIREFDRLENNPGIRLYMPELSFDIDLPDSVIDQINIDDIHKSQTLELV